MKEDHKVADGRLSVEEQRKLLRNFRIVAAVALATIIIGAVFYHHVEKLSWVDSFYFCVVTLATVGYGDITPTTEIGKIFTIFYILSGVGIIATFANLFLKRAVLVRKSDTKK